MKHARYLQACGRVGDPGIARRDVGEGVREGEERDAPEGRQGRFGTYVVMVEQRVRLI